MKGRSSILLVDTTMLYSGIVYDGLENKVLKSGKYTFITTEDNVLETCRTLMEKRKATHEEAIRLFKSIPVIVVGRERFSGKMEEAYRLIGSRDKFDVPLVALALSMKNHDGIWTSDKDFGVVKHKFRIWRSRELV